MAALIFAALSLTPREPQGTLAGQKTRHLARACSRCHRPQASPQVNVAPAIRSRPAADPDTAHPPPHVAKAEAGHGRVAQSEGSQRAATRPTSTYDPDRPRAPVRP